jgi:hypothetical protein
VLIGLDYLLFPEMVLNAHSQYLAGKQAGQKYGKNYFICPGSNQAFCKGYSESLDEITDYVGECANQTTRVIDSNFIGCPFDYVQSVAGFPMLVGNWNFVNESNIRGGSEISGKLAYGANGHFNQTISELYKGMITEIAPMNIMIVTPGMIKLLA